MMTMNDDDDDYDDDECDDDDDHDHDDDDDEVSRMATNVLLRIVMIITLHSSPLYRRHRHRSS